MVAHMRTNVKSAPNIRTHEGAPARRITPTQELERSVMACLLFESQFYESGIDIADRIKDLVERVDPTEVAQIAIRARNEMYLRHVPLLLVRELARRTIGSTHPNLVGNTLNMVIQRADELTEFLAIYWKDGRQPLSAQVKRGLALAFTKFDAYQLAKYNRDGAVRLKDVLFLCHAKPKDETQAAIWKQLVDGTLPTPDTWETTISGSKGEGKREHWTRLIEQKRMGGLALLRNLRNMEQAGVDAGLIRGALAGHSFKRVLPFRFVSAAAHAPRFEAQIDAGFLRVCGQAPRLPGKTLVVIDVSGSMYGHTVSEKSDMDRALAACALGAILREVCEDPVIYATAGNDGTRIHQTSLVPARRGMALVDAVHKMCGPLGGGGIFLNPVCRFLAERERDVDRMVVITDEQDCATSPKDSPIHAKPLGVRNYLINVATYKNGIGYGTWTHIDGWSENVVRYILEAEKAHDGSAASQNVA